jgi:hypothetical protein
MEKKDESSQRCTFTNISIGIDNITEDLILTSQVSSFTGGIMTCQKLRDQSNFMERYYDFWYSKKDNMDYVDYEGSTSEEEDEEDAPPSTSIPTTTKPSFLTIKPYYDPPKENIHYLEDVMM